MEKKKGYSDYSIRIPPGWKLAQSGSWLINNSDPGEREIFDIEKWRLETYGFVDKQLNLTYEEFRKLPHESKKLDHHCIDGWSYLGQIWNGVELAVIKELTKVQREAKYILVEGAGGVSQSFPIDQDLLLADGQNNGPLPRPAGYPLRVIAPGQFGNRSIKWVRKLKFCKNRETDSREEKYLTCGLYDLYKKEIADRDPWTVDNPARKTFLRKLFSYNTEVKRRKKQAEYNNNKTQTQALGSEAQEQYAFGVPLCKVSDLQNNTPSKFVVHGNEILLIKSEDQIYAIEPMCTHQGTDLSRGKLNFDAMTVSCPKHGACFDLATGKCLAGSYGCDGDGFPDARTYRIILESGIVFVELDQNWGKL